MSIQPDQVTQPNQQISNQVSFKLNIQLLPKYNLNTLQEISYTAQDPLNASSLYYIQRAIVSFFQELHQKAIEDLQKAAQIDSLNPIIYYNLASVQIYKNLKIEALKNIYCAVSCLYLKRALIRQQQIDTHRALKNCPNNVDAKILLGIYLIRDKKLYLALRQIKSAIQMNPDIEGLYKIKEDIEKYLNMGGSGSLIKVQGQSRSQSQKKRKLTYQQLIPDQQNIQTQLNLKIKQFKELYTELYGQTTKQSTENIKIWILNNQNSQKFSPEQEIVSQSQQETLLLQSNQLINNVKIIPRRISKDQMSSQRMIKYTRRSKSTISLQKQQREVEKIQTQVNQKQQSIVQAIQQTFDREEKANKKVSNQSTSDRNQQFQEIDDSMLKFIQIKVLECEFSLEKQVLQNMKNVYCIVIFNGIENKFNSKQVQVENSATWNQTFEKQMEQIKLQKLKVKVYNKKLKSIRDEFIGQGEISLPDFGSYKFPIYSKENKTGSVSVQIRQLLKKEQQLLL